MSGNYHVQGLPPCVNGTLSLETWNEARRKEILELFRTEVYGKIPDDPSLSVSFRVADSSPGFMEGRAVRKIVEISVRRGDREFVFPLFLFIRSEGFNTPPFRAFLRY
jgi:hypothetical protein